MVDFDAPRCPAARLNLEFGGEGGGLLTDSLLLNMEILDAQGVPGLQTDRLPDSLGYVPRSPIPAILIGSLAGIRRSGYVFFVSGVMRGDGRQYVGEGLHLRNHRFNGGMKDHPQ